MFFPNRIALRPKVVVDVKGKRVVLIFNSAVLPADQFPTFLDSARKLLRSLTLG